MANCPVCQTEINEDFGLVTCSSCGSQVLLELDGPAEALPPLPDLPNMAEELSQFLVAEVEVESRTPIASGPTSSDMSDIADFGNSPMSQGREGMLRFNLFIWGIDTSDIRGEVREALADERFLWDADQVMNSIQNGELSIKEVTPVKSALLLQKLRAIPVEIRWEQYAIHQS